MPVVSLFLIQLQPGARLSQPSVLAGLAAVQDLYSTPSDTTYPCQWLQQTEDPTILYLLCEWSDAALCREAFSQASASRQHLNELLDGYIQSTTARLFIINVAARDIPLEAPIISIGCHTVLAENQDALELFFQSNRNILDDYVTCEKRAVGGWRLEGTSCVREEWWLFVGWESWRHHYDFITIEGFKQYGKILNLLSGYESRHARVLHLSPEDKE